MTIEKRPLNGPRLSLVDGAGRPSEWHCYTEGQAVCCPGIKNDRRGTERGDRRSVPRLVPCTRKWPRVQRGCVTMIRVMRDQAPCPPSLPLWCEKCRCDVEIKTHAANEAA